MIAYLKKEGGVKGILKKVPKPKAVKAGNQPGRDVGHALDQEEEPDETDIGTEASGDVADELFDEEVDIAARVGSETLERVLSSEIPMNEDFYLVCRKTGSIGRNGILIEGELYEPNSE